MAPSRRTLLAGLAGLGLGGLALRLARGTPALRRRDGPVSLFSTSWGGTEVDVVRVDLQRARLELHWRRPDGERFGSLRAVHDWLRARGEQPVALTNAGIFGDQSPLGLHVEGGAALHPLRLGAGGGNFYLKPNGVFLVGAHGAAVVESSRFDAAGVQLATQSGPLLLARGALHPRFHAGSRNALLRSGVGVRTPDEVFLAVTRGAITFYDFALLFRDRLGCADALYLDGVISRLYAPLAGRDDDGSFMGVLAALDASSRG
jgi:uncharacterized protein YigE (DUF2233 family)